MSSDKSGRLWQSSMPAVQKTHLETQTTPWVCPGRWEWTENVSSFCPPTDHLCSACCPILLLPVQQTKARAHLIVNRGEASKWGHRRFPENMVKPCPGVILKYLVYTEQGLWDRTISKLENLAQFRYYKPHGSAEQQNFVILLTLFIHVKLNKLDN